MVPWTTELFTAQNSVQVTSFLSSSSKQETEDPMGPKKKKRGRKKEADSRNLSVFLVAGKIKNVVKVKEEHEQLYNIKKKTFKKAL